MDFCGFTLEDTVGHQPKDLLQGELTSQEHIKIMRDYFANAAENLAANLPLVIENLINYRNVLNAAGEKERMPFKFKLTAQPLHSVGSGQAFPVFQVLLQNEQDLFATEQFRNIPMPVAVGAC